MIGCRGGALQYVIRTRACGVRAAEPAGMPTPACTPTMPPRRRRLQALRRHLGADKQPAAQRRGAVAGVTAAGDEDAVAVVDISAWTSTSGSAEARARAVEAMSRSFHRSGLCLITGHGVPSALRERTYDASLEFFRQEQRVKDRFASREKGTPGYMAMGQQHLGQTLSADTLPADMNEFLVFSTGAEGHPEGIGSMVDGVSRTQDIAVVPTVPPELPTLFDEYTAAMDRLNLALMRVTATALGQHASFFEPFFSPGQYTLQMRYYPALGPEFVPEPGQMRIGAHADSNGFTIVRIDGKPGLEVRIEDEDGQRSWHAVALPGPAIDALVVNTGRMIERWTGGFFKAAVHRVVAEEAALRGERLSLAFFSSREQPLAPLRSPAAANISLNILVAHAAPH